MQEKKKKKDSKERADEKRQKRQKRKKRKEKKEQIRKERRKKKKEWSNKGFKLVRRTNLNPVYARTACPKTGTCAQIYPKKRKTCACNGP